MKFKIILFITLLIILIDYSSEISFMPNFKFKPDKWHLIVPMSGFLLILGGQFLWCILEMIKNKKASWNMIILSTMSILLFLSLNNPDRNSQNIGYIGLIIVSFILIIRYQIEKRKQNY